MSKTLDSIGEEVQKNLNLLRSLDRKIHALDNQSHNVSSIVPSRSFYMFGMLLILVSKHDRDLSFAAIEAVVKASKLPSYNDFNEYYYYPQDIRPEYTGNELLLKELRLDYDISRSPSNPLHSKQKIFVVHGMGGSGKTQFCCKFAEENRQRHVR